MCTLTICIIYMYISIPLSVTGQLVQFNMLFLIKFKKLLISHYPKKIGNFK